MDILKILRTLGYFRKGMRLFLTDTSRRKDLKRQCEFSVVDLATGKIKQAITEPVSEAKTHQKFDSFSKFTPAENKISDDPCSGQVELDVRL